MACRTGCETAVWISLPFITLIEPLDHHVWRMLEVCHRRWQN